MQLAASRQFGGETESLTHSQAAGNKQILILMESLSPIHVNHAAINEGQSLDLQFV